MSTAQIDYWTIWELHNSHPGAQVDEEWGGWRLEEEVRLRDDDWYSHWRMVVSRENRFHVREYYRGKFRRGLTDWVRAREEPPAELTFTEVYPVTRTVTRTVTEYKSDLELIDEGITA